MARLTLSAEEDYNFKLLGISCHAKDYRLSWAINMALGIELEKAAEKEPEEGKELPKPTFLSQFSMFVFSDTDSYLDYTLISNRGSSGFFVPEQKKTDYFLKIEGDLAADRWAEIIETLKKIDIVLALYDLKPESLRSKQNFLFIYDN